MHIHTLAIILSVNNIMHVIALFLQYRLNKTQKGLGCWAFGSFFIALGYTFNYFRAIPTIGSIMIVMNNAMFLLGFALFYIGVLRFFDQQEWRHWRLTTFCCVIIFFSVYFTYINNSLEFRRINLSIGIAVLAFLVARALFLYKNQSVTDSVYFLASVFLATTIFFSVRAITPFITSAEDIFTPSTTQITTYMFVFITSTLWTFGFILLVNHQDVRNQKMAEKALESLNRKLELLSITDGLTGIANRRHFDDVLKNEYDRHIRSSSELSLIILDIDYFKKFNDYYGHIKGDECLQRVAKAIAHCVTRPADLAARYGGEEFACILPETDNKGALAVAEKIRLDTMNMAIPHKGSPVAECVTVSVGVVTVQCSPEQSIKEIINQADKMLYRAKSLGRNRVEFIAQPVDSMKYGREIKGNFVRLVWQETFCSGNYLIDSQHESLFKTANELLEMLFSSHPDCDVLRSITKLIDDVAQHFKDEETILGEINFPGISQHSALHGKLVVKAVSLLEDFNLDTLSVDALLQFLVNEIIMKHMLGSDCEYFQFIKNKAR